MKVMIIEDDIVIRKELSKFLTANLYEITIVEEFSNVLEQINLVAPHLILLDINLPHTDGYSICRKLRETSEVPVIILTSRDTEMDELMSINLGADDFIKKPFNPQILLARIDRILKRSYKTKTNEVIECSNIKLDLVKASITHNNKTEILTKNELAILDYFFRHQGELISRDDLMVFLWDASTFVDDNTLSVNITRLRKKLETIDVKDAIKTRRGLGYSFL